MSARRALFLDRDGTIIEDMNYLSDPAKICFLPGAQEALRRFQDAGYQLVIVTNQSGIGRGFMTAEESTAVHERVVAALAEARVRIDGSYICPHAPKDRCECRKPQPTLLRRAARELDIDLSSSFMIGDKYSDVGAGAAAGCTTLLINHKPGDARQDGTPEADFVCENWDQVVAVLSGRDRNIGPRPY